jgi:hypothetical protein
MGLPEPPGEALFDRNALKAALPEVSKVRFEQTLCAEHPGLKPLLDRLEGEKTQQTPTTMPRSGMFPKRKRSQVLKSCLRSGFSSGGVVRNSRSSGFRFSIGMP